MNNFNKMFAYIILLATFASESNNKTMNESHKIKNNHLLKMVSVLISCAKDAAEVGDIGTSRELSRKAAEASKLIVLK